MCVRAKLICVRRNESSYALLWARVVAVSSPAQQSVVAKERQICVFSGARATQRDGRVALRRPHARRHGARGDYCT